MTEKVSIFGKLLDHAQEWVELYEVDASKYGLGTFRFYSGTNERSGDIIWQGNVYTSFPVQTDGWGLAGEGSLSRPKVTFSNVTKIITNLTVSNNDLIGCKFTRKRTMVCFLDAVNFTDGNAGADPHQHLPDDIYVIAQKIAENKLVVEFELSSGMDLTGISIPKRQVVNNLCSWQYRGEECGYTGGAVADENNIPTTEPNKDSCGKRLSSCKLRFGEHGELPFGGFPASSLVPRQ